MRHKKSFNHLGRTASHRKAMLSNMASQLIIHKRINTTLAKAKALRTYVEPLITKSKNDSTHSRRTVFSHLQNKEAISELYRDVAQKVLDRPGGYTRILKTGFRKGDAAEMCFIELVDYNENMLSTSEESTQKRTRRGRRAGTKKTTPEAAVQQSETVKDEQQVAEESDNNKKNDATDAKVDEKAADKTVGDKSEQPEPKIDAKVEKEENKADNDVKDVEQNNQDSVKKNTKKSQKSAKNLTSENKEEVKDEKKHDDKKADNSDDTKAGSE